MKLSGAIAPAPSTLAMTASVAEAIPLMQPERSVCDRCCPQDASLLAKVPQPWNDIAQGCVLVMDGDRLMGILTERDIVRLAAQGKSLDILPVAMVMSAPVITLNHSDLTNSFVSLALFQQHQIHHLPVTDEAGKVVGLLTAERLQPLLQALDLLHPFTAAEAMTSPVVQVPPTASLATIHQKLAYHATDTVLIVEADGTDQHPLGVLTERDIVRLLALGINLETVQAQDVMAQPVVSAPAEASLPAVQQLMHHQHTHQAAILQGDGTVAGVLSQTAPLNQMSPELIYRMAGQMAQMQTHQLQAQAVRTQLLQQLATQPDNALELQALLDNLVSSLRSVLSCDRVFVYQHHPAPENGVRAESVGEGWLSCVGDRTLLPYFQEQTNALADGSHILAIDDLPLASPYHLGHQPLAPYHVQALITVPIMVGGTLWGLLIGHRCDQPRPWRSSDRSLLAEIALQVAIAIQQAEHESTTLQQTANILRERSEYLRSIYEGVEQSIFTLNVLENGEFRFLDFNPAAEKAMGKESANQLRGKPPGQDVHFHYKECLQAGEAITYEEQLTFQNKPSWWITTLTPIRDVSGRIYRIVGTSLNIDNRKQAEQERLQAAQMRRELTILEALLENTLAGYWDANLVKGTQYISPGFKRMFGYADHELVNSPKTWKDLVFPDDLPKAHDAYQRHVESHGQIPYRVELRYRHKDGSTVWIVCSGQVIEWDEAGNPIRLIGCHIDITERKQAEAALLKTGKRYQALMDSASDAIVLADPQGQILEVNHKAEELFGYSREELTRLRLPDLYPTDVLDEVHQHFSSTAAGNEEPPIETLIQQRTGETLPVSITAASIALDGEHIIQGIFRDIHARKQAEQENQQLRERLQFVLSSNPAVIFTCKPDQNFTVSFISENLVQVTGYRPAELMEDPYFWVNRIHPDDVSQVLKDRAILFEQGYQNQEYRILHRDGHYLWVRSDMRLVHDDTDNPSEITGYLADISDRKQAELDLQASEIRFRRIFESSVVGMIFTNFSGQILNANDRFLEMVGYTRKDLQAGAINWAKMTPPEYVAADHAAVQQLQQWGVIEPWEKEYIRKDGSRISILLGAGILPGTTDQALCVVVDNSGRKRAETRLQQQANREHLLNTIAQRMRTSLNLQTVIDTAVTELHQVLRCDRVLVYRVLPDRTGKAIAESVSPGWPVILGHLFTETRVSNETYDHYAQGETFVLNDRAAEGLGKRSEGFLTGIEFRAKLVVPIVQNETLWGLVIAHQCDRPRSWQFWEVELLQQLSGQLAIAIQQSELYSQLEDNHLQLTHINTELLRATRLKDEFLANMSHELRTPLNAILGMSESLMEGVFGPISDDQQHALATVEESGEHLLGLINDILELSKIEAGKLELRHSTISVEHLCQSSLAFVQQQAFKKKLQLNVILPPDLGEITVDERRMRQVLINLLSNAVKFTPAEGCVTLRVEQEPHTPNLAENTPLDSLTPWVASPTDDASPPLEKPLGERPYLRISVEDTGIGIRSEDQARLFKPFVQVDSRLNRKYEGTGLGLVLVKRIVELHGGSVCLRSHPGEGSCFTVCLPSSCKADPTPSSPVKETSAPKPSNSPKHSPVAQAKAIAPKVEGAAPLILLAEDNETNVQTMTDYLKAKGYRLIAAKNGEEAIALVKAHTPDLILMDIQMPKMDGIEAMQHLRQSPDFADIPIIALTALAMEGDRDRCLQAGANDYMAKPIRLRELNQAIYGLLKAQTPA
ncbi:MAG: PAS domain S-box protein [Cyanobacteria bacterium J06638_22]